MEQYETIRTMHRVYKKSIREISLVTGHSRQVIRKVLHNEPMEYKKREAQPYPKLGPYIGVIVEWLKDDKEAPRKQRHTARRVYNRLRAEHGFDGSESNIRRVVRNLKGELGLNGPGAFIPGDPQTAVEAEVDWGTAVVDVQGKRRQVKLFCMRSKYSGKFFLRVYPCERQQAFFDGHIHAFLFYGGVFQKVIYDNLGSAVKPPVKWGSRIEQESFIKFRSYYSFKAVFTNLNSGNEKGGVEGLVGFARRNFLTPVPKVESLAALNLHLWEECSKYGSHRIDGHLRSIEENHEIEQKELLALPETPFSNVLTSPGKVDKYSTVIIDKNRYSVPTSYAGRRVNTILEVGRVKIFAAGTCIAVHERLYGNNQWQLDPAHYLELLRQRPRAFDSARPIRQWQQSWPSSYLKLLERFRSANGMTDGTKAFIDVLTLHKEYSAAEVEAAAEIALESGVSDYAGVKHLLLYVNEEVHTPEPLRNFAQQPHADVSVYAALEGM